MAGSLFSVPIFFIVFRETLEAAIIISVLLALVEQIVREDQTTTGRRLFVADWRHPNANLDKNEQGARPELSRGKSDISSDSDSGTESQVHARLLMRKLRIQIALGSAAGFVIALAIGAAFIAVYFTQAADLFAKSEELWEGIFSLLASLIILAMGVTILRLDQAKARWRVKLMRAFAKQNDKKKGSDRDGKTARWVFFLLPFITVLREGMEAVVFIGGVSLGEPARAIPIAAIVGIICGLAIGLFIYAFASRSTIRVFLIVMTNFILLVGAGLFSKSVGNFEKNAFNTLLGGDADDAGGVGPGSFDVRGSVWHVDCCSPEGSDGYAILAALFGWTNSASVGTVISYVVYWLLVIAILVFMKFHEGRTTLFGRESAARKRRREIRARDDVPATKGEEVEELPR